MCIVCVRARLISILSFEVLEPAAHWYFPFVHSFVVSFFIFWFAKWNAVECNRSDRTHISEPWQTSTANQEWLYTDNGRTVWSWRTRDRHSDQCEKYTMLKSIHTHARARTHSRSNNWNVCWWVCECHNGIWRKMNKSKKKSAQSERRKPETRNHFIPNKVNLYNNA